MSSTTNTRSVRFADMAQLLIIEQKQKDNSKLWYTQSEYYSMRQAIQQDVLQVREQALAGVPFNYAGDDDATDLQSSVCCVGIEHLLTPALALESAADRERCIRAVLVAQSRQDVSEMDIAQDSLAQTRKLELRARFRGVLLKNSI